MVTFNQSICQFTMESQIVSHPSATVKVPKGFKLIGGGAIIYPFSEPPNPSNFLTASYPLDPETWFAAGKDHEISSPGSIIVSAFAIPDADDIWDVKIVSATSDVLSHPKVTVALPDDYVLTSGGAFVDYRGAGNMLTASFPRANPDGDGDWYIWEAHSKDHDVSDPAALTVYAIGIRLRSAPAGSPGLQNIVTTSATTDPTDKPQITTTGPAGLVLTGGGAWDHWSGAGNMLTASGPAPDAGTNASAFTWLASGTDHITSSPATISGWAIYPEAVDALQPARRIARLKTGEIPPLDSPYRP